ncbi:MAG: hypothetical protein JWN02_2189, partial [Acidobacteria bacterium]|nr:hypothetical protein [Acidobacteriota bacterium]
GAKKCHIIAHSKGGLDTRAYLNNQYPSSPLQVLSVYTLSTPHHGTPLADIGVAVETAASPLLAQVQGFFWPAPSQQTTYAMQAFNADYPGIPGNILFYNYGADADRDGDAVVTTEEAHLLLRNTEIPTVLATSLYQAIGNIASVRVTTSSHLWGLESFTSIDVETTAVFAHNDLVVSTGSAHSPFGTYLATRSDNHGSLKSEDLARQILKRILTDFPNN